jgi:hypothetical protein
MAAGLDALEAEERVRPFRLVACRRELVTVVVESNRSRAWNGVPPETMKMQPRILHYVQDDKHI